MGISIFPSSAAEFVENNFVIDMNDTSNNTADTGGIKDAGPYGISLSSGDTSFDVYFIDVDGNNVGYSNSTSITASAAFDTVVILGVSNDEIITFAYAGSVNNADGFGDEPGAGAFLTSITPTDLPSIDDTATVVGGNFGADTEITFESGATVLPAKSITVVTGTELLVTRPDGLIEDDAPYTVRAVTTGVPQPTGSNANLLVDAVTAGSDPTWVTTSPLNFAELGVAFTQTLEATDAEGTVTDYSVTAGTLTPGLTLNASTGVLSGTPTAGGNFTFTVTATDDGGNTTAKEFEQIAGLPIEYLVIAGGGGSVELGGGGAGGYRSSVSGESSGGGASAEESLKTALATNISVTVGAGGPASSQTNGSNSILGDITSLGGGFGAGANGGGTGGSGGGGRRTDTMPPGSGTANQGFAGGEGVSDVPGGGGGASESGTAGVSGTGVAGDGGDGVASLITGVSTFRAGGGAGGRFEISGKTVGSPGQGGGGAASSNGTANTGGGGGGNDVSNPGAGGSGVVILKYDSAFDITIGAGLTGTTATVGGNKVTTITAGTGNISFSEAA